MHQQSKGLWLLTTCLSIFGCKAVMRVQVNDNMGRAPSIDDALPSSSGRTPAMSRAHSLHSSASGPNAAGPSHHEHLVLLHQCIQSQQTAACTPPLQCVPSATSAPLPGTPSLRPLLFPLVPTPAPYLYTQPAYTSQSFSELQLA